MTLCLHKRLRAVTIFLEPNPDQAFPVAVFMVRCHDCGRPFRFATDLIETSGIQVSEDGKELRVEIKEAIEGRIQ